MSAVRATHDSPTASATTRLSDVALAYAATLHTLDGGALARRLYDFGRRPLTDHWLSTVAARGGVRGLLDLDRPREADRAFARRWAPRHATHAEHSWIVWDRAPRSRRTRPTARATYKLYVAPTPATTPSAFRTAAAALARSGAFAFKVAAGAHALLRPDKLVAYFHTRDALDAAAAALRSELHGMPAQPVPFTAALTPDGLLSWGTDPPGMPPAGAEGITGTSWRAWVTTRLGAYLALARVTNGSALAPADFARRRLALDGVDVERWAPIAPRWHDQTPPGA